MNDQQPYDFSETAMDWSNPGSIAILPVSETPAQIAAAESSPVAVALDNAANSIPSIPDVYGAAAGAVGSAVSDVTNLIPSKATLFSGAAVLIVIMILALLLINKVETI